MSNSLDHTVYFHSLQVTMATMVAKGLSDLLQLKIEVNDGDVPNAANAFPVLDLDCIHKYSLHWVSPDGSVADRPKGSPSATSSAIREHNAGTDLSSGINAMSIKNDEIKVTIKTLTGKTTALRMKREMTVSKLKTMIQITDGIDRDQQKLMFQNKTLEDEKELSHYEVNNNSTIFMIVSVKERAAEFQLVPKSFLDPGYDYNYSASDGNKVFKRGTRTFIRPCGWMKKALLVLSKYENDEWLGTSGRQSEVSSVGGEWPVAYHGTKKSEVEAICKQPSDIKARGRNFVQGKGIYTTWSPDLAEQQTEAFEFEGSRYKMIFMDRVNMDYTAEYQSRNGHTYLITSDENSVRPYCILFKKV